MRKIIVFKKYGYPSYLLKELGRWKAENYEEVSKEIISAIKKKHRRNIGVFYVLEVVDNYYYLCKFDNGLDEHFNYKKMYMKDDIEDLIYFHKQINKWC